MLNSLNLTPNKLEQIKQNWYEGKLSQKEADQQIFTCFNYLKLGKLTKYGEPK